MLQHRENNDTSVLVVTCCIKPPCISGAESDIISKNCTDVSRRLGD